MIRLGCYNIDDEGEVWDKSTRYRMVVFSKFNQQEEEVGRKTIYFLWKNNTFNPCPDFKTEEEITVFLRDKKDCQRVAIERILKEVNNNDCK